MKPINKNPSIARVFVLVGTSNVISSVSEYLARIESLIFAKNKENATVEIRGPKWLPGGAGADWVLVSFSAHVTFSGGQVLEITDNFSRTSADTWKRKFSYFFGAPKDGGGTERIFLLDSHGFYGGPEHLHPENDERLMEGNPKLNGFSPNDVDLTEVLGFIDLYFDGKQFPWVLA
jgi:hypothetical protein